MSWAGKIPWDENLGILGFFRFKADFSQQEPSMRRPTEFPEFPIPENSPTSLANSGGPKSAWDPEVSLGIFSQNHGNFWKIPPKKIRRRFSFPSSIPTPPEKSGKGWIYPRFIPQFILDLSKIYLGFIPAFIPGFILDFSLISPGFIPRFIPGSSQVYPIFFPYFS